MEITYTVGYSHRFDGKDWSLFVKREGKETMIFDELKSHAKKNKDLSFDEMYRSLKEAYRNKKSRSRCSINLNTDWNRIEVCGTSWVFPKFYIVKK